MGYLGGPNVISRVFTRGREVGHIYIERTAAEVREDRKFYTSGFKNTEKDHELRNVCNL